MNEGKSKPRPWLIAAWPGMGNVAMIAAGHLIDQLKMVETCDLLPGEHFDVTEVEVRDGLVVPARVPRGIFFRWENPGQGRDLYAFVGMAQPTTGSYSYARELLETAESFDVERVVTFASLASGLHPSENPKVSCVATDAATLAELRRAEIEPITGGPIGGLNGLLLGVAAERGLAGMCLLAEIPFFAMNIPNPKASRAALSVFSVMAEVDIRLTALNEQGAIVDRALIELMEKLERQHEGEEDEQSEFGVQGTPSGTVAPAPASKEASPAGEPPLSSKDRKLIEELFEAARASPTQAVRLKNELDRLGVFKAHEGRFLDLFRRPG